jgi:hypothetical protein
MDSKIVSAMDKNEAEFLIAYHNHIKKIKMELN